MKTAKNVFRFLFSYIIVVSIVSSAMMIKEEISTVIQTRKLKKSMKNRITKFQN